MHVIRLSMNKLYFMKEVVKITGVNQPKLQQWLRDGFVHASVKGDGPGTRNQFDFNDLCIIMLFERLLESGVSRTAAANQVKNIPPLSLWEQDPEDAGFIINFTDLKTNEFAAVRVFIDGDEVETIKKEISEWVSKGFDMITLYSLKRIIQDVKEGIANL